MNLNISTNIMDYFQGNTNIVYENCNKSEFSGLLQIMEESFNDISSELDSYIKDSEGNIDYELLQGLLNGLVVLNFHDDLTNQNSISNKKEQGIDDLIGILNNISTKNHKEQLNKEVIFENSLDEIFLDSEMLNIDSLEKLKFSYTDNLDEKIENEDEITIKNQKDNIIDAVNIEESYNKLEISSLSNKSNLFNDTKSELEDDDLSVLQSTLEEGSDNISVFNNIISEIENTQSKVNVESSPIRELRQEVIGDDIVQTVRYLNEKGIEEIKVKINPKELGEMTIKIMKSTEEVNLSITISNEETYNLVNKNTSEITKHLKALDINIKEIFIEVKSNSENLFSENFNQEFNRNNQNNEKSKKNKSQKLEVENIDGIDNIETKDNNLNILI